MARLVSLCVTEGVALLLQQPAVWAVGLAGCGRKYYGFLYIPFLFSPLLDIIPLRSLNGNTAYGPANVGRLKVQSELITSEASSELPHTSLSLQRQALDVHCQDSNIFTFPSLFLSPFLLSLSPSLSLFFCCLSFRF